MPNARVICVKVIGPIKPSELLVNIGSKSDGVVPQSDLSRLDSAYVKSLKVGMTVDVVVAKQPEDDGIFILSMADALQAAAGDWLTAQQMLESGEISTHRPSFNKGGITVEFNHLRGFVPASHIIDMPRNLSEDQRREEFSAHRQRSAAEGDRSGSQAPPAGHVPDAEPGRISQHGERKCFKRLNVGDVVHGVRCAPCAPLVHSSTSAAWTVCSTSARSALATSITHREAIQVGQEIEVQVIRIDSDSQRVALSRKRLLSNPWDGIEERYKLGAVVPATVTRLRPNSAPSLNWSPASKG